MNASRESMGFDNGWRKRRQELFFRWNRQDAWVLNKGLSKNVWDILLVVVLVLGFFRDFEDEDDDENEEEDAGRAEFPPHLKASGQLILRPT